MPHDAATYFPNEHLTVKTPKQTYDRVQDEVFDARVEYRQTARSSYSQYKYLTTGVAPQPVPTIASFNPETGVVDPEKELFEVVITGTGFTAQSKVWWNDALYTPSAWTATTLTVTVPAAPKKMSYPVYVSNLGVPSDVENYKFTAAVENEPVEKKAKSVKKGRS